jgi:DNA-binding NarL/FixJ family response regulator
VLLADDHLLVAEALKSLLISEFDLVGVVEDGRELVKAAGRLRPDVIVADVTMPCLNGIDALIQLRQGGDRVPVVFLTMHRDVSFARRALEAGASGFVLKHSAAVELIAALRAALAGKTYLTPQLAGEVLAVMKQGPARAADPVDALTLRQREVLQLVAEGRSAKEIASSLSISARTVEFHKYQMMETLGLHTNAELIHFAVKHGLVELWSPAREFRSVSAMSPVISRGHNPPQPDYARVDG